MNTPTRQKSMLLTQSQRIKMLHDDFYRWTKEALWDVDRHHVIEHSEVISWANSLQTNQPKSPPLHDNSMDT